MKIALVSDIHGNAVALEAVVLRAEEERVDAFAFLGDYVCDFPNPQRVLEIVRRLQTRYPMWLIRGNREEYLIGHRDGKSDWWGTGTAGGSLLFTYQRLDQSDLALFDRMPFQMEIALDGHRPFSICHASPFQAREWMIRDDARIRACLDYIPTDFLFCGHAHEIRAFRYGGKQAHFVGSCGIDPDEYFFPGSEKLDGSIKGALQAGHKAYPPHWSPEKSDIKSFLSLMFGKKNK